MAVHQNRLIKSSSLLRSTALVSSMTLLSRVLGFVRDIIIAQIFGATLGMDAFLVAFKIPNFMRRLFAEGAFSQAFVPVLAEYQEQQNHSSVRRFLSHIAGNLGSVLLLVTLLAIIASPILIRVFAPGFEHTGPRFTLTTALLRITFPYLMLISLTALAGAVLNTYGQFGIPAFTPVLLNLALIIGAVIGRHYFEVPITALAWAVFIAGLIQLLFQLPFLYRTRLLVKPVIDWRDPGVRRVLKLMIPALFGVSVAQINLLLDTLFASFLPVGSISWLYYSDRLMNFPLGVFGVAIATVILPHLSRKHADKNQAQYHQALDWGLRMTCLIAIPSAIGLGLLAQPILASLLGYGKFSNHDVEMASLSLYAFAWGIPAFMLIKVLASAFYARQDIKTPVKVGAGAMLANTLLCISLIGPLAHQGLALASTLAAYINAFGLLIILIKRDLYKPKKAWRAFSLRMLIANGLCLGWLEIYRQPLDGWLNSSASVRIFALITAITVAIVIYVCSLFIMGFRLSDLRVKEE